MSRTEAESSRTIIMLAMMTGSTSLEEEIANMTVILEKLTRDSEEKEACIKLQEVKIAKLTKKFKIRSAQSSTKDSESKDSGKVSIHIEASDNEKQPKKGTTPKNVKASRSMTIEQIQDLITNVVKAQLGEGSRRTNLYTKPYTRRVDALLMPQGY